MTNPFFKMRLQMDLMRMEMANMRQYVAGLEARVNAVAYQRGASGGASPAGCVPQAVPIVVPDGGGSGDLVAEGWYVDTLGGTDRAAVDTDAPEQTAVAGATDVVDGTVPYGVLANVLWAGHASDGVRTMLNTGVWLGTPGVDGVTAEDSGPMVVVFGGGNAYPVCVLAD